MCRSSCDAENNGGSEDSIKAAQEDRSEHVSASTKYIYLSKTKQEDE